jgi:viologen exporter family transport system permease protein
MEDSLPRVRYGRVYLAFVKANVQRLLEYRMSFFIGIASVLTRHVVGVLTLWVIFTQVDSIGGWSAYQVVYLYAFVNLISAIHHFFFMNTFRLEFAVQYGELDIYLTRPLPALYSLMLYYFDDDAIGDLVPAIILLFVSSAKLGIVYTPAVILVFAMGVTGGVLLYFGIHLTLACWSFWFVKSRSLIRLFGEVRRFTEYPLRIFSPSIQLVLTVLVPIAFAGFYPTEDLLSRSTLSWVSYLCLPVGVAVLAVGVFVWRIGLSRYASTGS